MEAANLVFGDFELAQIILDLLAGLLPPAGYLFVVPSDFVQFLPDLPIVDVHTSLISLSEIVAKLILVQSGIIEYQSWMHHPNLEHN